MGCCGCCKKDDRDRNKVFHTEQEDLYIWSCTPKKGAIIAAAVIGALLAILLVILPLLYLLTPYPIVPGTQTGTLPGTVGTVGTPGTNAPTAPFTTTLAPGTPSTTLPPGTTSYAPCIDYEPALCARVAYEGLCPSWFAHAQCCQTCQIDVACRDTHEGCFKVRIYGMCVDDNMRSLCCASCHHMF